MNTFVRYIQHHKSKIIYVLSGTALGCVVFVGHQVYLLTQIESVSQSQDLDRHKKEYIIIEHDKNNEKMVNHANALTSTVHEVKAPWFPWVKSWSEDPWTLLRLAESNEHSVRLLGVKALAEKHYWHDSIYIQLSQALCQRTLIGLARSPGVDERFFLPPPQLPKTKLCIEDYFRDLLSMLPSGGIDECTKYFTSKALHEGHESTADERGGLWCFGGNGLAFTQSLSAVPEMQVEMFCLQALASHSQVQSHVRSIVHLGGLQLLQRVAQSRPNMLRIERLVARIIANLTIEESLHADIVQSGWVGMLIKWLQSQDAGLSGQAARALANLDRDYGLEKYLDGVFLVYPTHRFTEPVYVDVVFVHGLLGGAFKTWRQYDTTVDPKPNPKQSQEQQQITQVPIDTIDKNILPNPVTVLAKSDEESNGDERDSSDDIQDGVSSTRKEYTFCWPKDWLSEDCPNTRILTVEYDTNLSEWAPKCPFDTEQRSLQVRASDMLVKLKKAGLGKRPIIWIGHSMGGLLIKQMLTTSNQDPNFANILKQTKGLVMYSVPHKGSPLAAYAAQAKFILAPSVEATQLLPDSALLNKLNDEFSNIVTQRKISCLNYGETRKMNIGLNVSVLIVPEWSSDIGIGEYISVDTEHLNVCKPRNRDSINYQRTLQFIKEHASQNLVEHVLEAGNVGGDYILPGVLRD